MAFTPKLTYKGKPLVRKDNELYYGNMTDPYVLYLQITTTKPVGDQQVADKVHLMLLSTDTTKAPQERVMRQTTKIGVQRSFLFILRSLQSRGACRSSGTWVRRPAVRLPQTRRWCRSPGRSLRTARGHPRHPLRRPLPERPQRSRRSARSWLRLHPDHPR